MANADRAKVLGDIVNAPDVAKRWESYDLDRQRAIVAAVVTVTLHKNKSGGNTRGGPQPLRVSTVGLDWFNPQA